MSQQKVKFGTQEVTGDFAGKTLDELKEWLEGAYDSEMPTNCEYVVDGDVRDGNDIVEDEDDTIEINAVAGKKA